MENINFNFSKNIDGVFITKPENIRWISGFNGSFGLVFLKKNGEKILISDGRYAEIAEKNLPENWKFQIFDKDFKQKFGETISGTFWIEDSVSLSELKRYKKLFPNVKFSSKADFLEKKRRQKNEDEIEKIKTAQSHVDRILVPFLQSELRAGTTEREIAFKLEHAIRGEGKFGLSFDAIVAFGKNSALPHHHPSEQKLKKGDNILIDCGAKFEEYCSDMTRNFVFGPARQDFVNKFEICQKAQKEILVEYKIGKKVKDLEDSCRKSLGKDEKYFVHSLGHGVGLEIHEMPRISTKSNEKLVENEVVTCEPGIYYPEKFGIRIEDLLVIRKNGPEILSKTPKELIVF